MGTLQEDSVDKGLAPTLEVATNVSFSIPSTTEPLFKHVHDCEEPDSQIPPPPTFMPPNNSVTNSKEGGWACPILEEVPP